LETAPVNPTHTALHIPADWEQLGHHQYCELANLVARDIHSSGCIFAEPAHIDVAKCLQVRMAQHRVCHRLRVIAEKTIFAQAEVD
jgi:hypothetical protein